eukprot:1147260-Pelagomonas_calceolata.AAC.3
MPHALGCGSWGWWRQRSSKSIQTSRTVTLGTRRGKLGGGGWVGTQPKSKRAFRNKKLCS